MKKNIITTAATIIASATLIFSGPSITAFAATPAAVTATKTITQEQALDIALKHAGYKKNQVSFPRVHLDYDDGIQKYEVEFYVGFCEYNYDIAASNGQIIGYDIGD